MKRFYHAFMRLLYRFAEEDAAIHGRYSEAIYWIDESERKHGKK